VGVIARMSERDAYDLGSVRGNMLESDREQPRDREPGSPSRRVRRLPDRWS
jgi:hypothetical protein